MVTGDKQTDRNHKTKHFRWWSVCDDMWRTDRLPNHFGVGFT